VAADLTAAAERLERRPNRPQDGRVFPETRLSVVARAVGADPKQRAASLELLARSYYRPIYAHLRCKWRLSATDAEDMTQAFFVSVAERDVFASFSPERARFRTFVRACVDHLAEDELRAKTRLKRGGGKKHVSFDFTGVESAIGPTVGSAADDAFDREWTRVLVSMGIEELKTRLAAAGKARYFTVFERFDLAPDARPSYAAIAEELSISVYDVTNYLHAARKELKRAIADQLRNLTASEAELREEAEALGMTKMIGRLK